MNQNQLPQIPPTVNYNNYFNKNKYRYTSKPRVASNTSNSLTSTQSEFKTKIQNIKRSDSSGVNKSSFYGDMRRNSQKSSGNERRTMRTEHTPKNDLRGSQTASEIITGQDSKYNKNLRIQ